MQVLALLRQTHDAKVGMETKITRESYKGLGSGFEALARPELWFCHWPK